MPPGNLDETVGGVRDGELWRPIADAPRDGTPIWAWLYDSGIRLMVWMNPAECAAYEGSSDPSEYDGSWAEAFDLGEDWSPKWWRPADEIGAPSDAQKFRDAIADTTERPSRSGRTT